VSASKETFQNVSLKIIKEEHVRTSRRPGILTPRTNLQLRTHCGHLIPKTPKRRGQALIISSRLATTAIIVIGVTDVGAKVIPWINPNTGRSNTACNSFDVVVKIITSKLYEYYNSNVYH